MAPPIEETLRPETVNELLLIQRINELHRAAYMNSGPLSMLTDPNHAVHQLAEIAPRLTLSLASSFQAGLELPHGNLKISARTHGPTSFGLAQYVTAEQLQSMPIGEEVRLFDHIWRDGMHRLAREVRQLAQADQ